ncbi:metap1 [Symbiodinium sp. CCMP2456]|nr:metap1 [Symbiodinium sp. CCMP2456]
MSGRRGLGPLEGSRRSEAEAQRGPLVVDPVHLVSWGGGLMPPVSSLEPRIREKALYSFYLPKLAEDGHSDEVLNRCVARATGATGKGLPGSRSASVGALGAKGHAMPPAQASSHSCSWMQHSHSLAHGRSESQSLGLGLGGPRSRTASSLLGPGPGPGPASRSGARKEARDERRRSSPPGPLGYLAGPESQWGPLARMFQKRSSV